MPHSLIWLLAALILAACNLSQPELPDLTPNDDNIIYITATPKPEVLVSDPAAATPLPTIPPTPTIEPAVLLQFADQQMQNGYYEDAIQSYQLVLAQGEDASPESRALAALKVGQSALREGLFTEAVNSLSLLITQFSNDPSVTQAYFLRGDAYLGLSMWNEAIADFQQYLTLRPGLIDSYVYERLADAQLALGQIDTAVANYGQALNTERTLVPQLILHEKVAQVMIRVGRIDDAVAQYDAILAIARNTPYRAEMDFLAAQALVQAGNLETGLARTQRIFNEYQSTTTAYAAMQILLENGFEIDDFQRGKVSFTFGDYQDTIDAFNRFTTQHQLAAIPAELHLILGRAYREIGNSSAALIAFQTVIDQHPGDPLFGDALLEQGRTRFLSGDIPNAIQTYLQIANTYTYLPDAAGEALWRAGYLYGTNDEPALSRQIFVQLADAYPNHELTTNGLFLAASAAVNAGEWAIAENLFGRLSALATGEDQAAAYLWVMRLALQRGDERTANDVLPQVIAAAPDSYFAARATDIQIGRIPFQRPTTYQFQSDEVTELAQAEAWLRQTFSITQEGDLWRLSSTLENDPRLIRGRELWAVAAYDEAEEEFDSLLEERRNNRDVLSAYQLAIYLRSIGSYLPSIVAAADVIRAGNVSTLDAPAYIARMRYPVYYRDVVLDVSNQYGVDPLLLFSLIRHESLFNTFATAAAGEKGLTQVIPSTGQYIADQLNWQNYQHSDLFRPYAGVSFGAFYLDEQLDRFDGNVIAALSGYNAGPGRAIDWLALSGGDPDLFMTSITISSTRLYVQRIYGYHTIYRALYGMQ